MDRQETKLLAIVAVVVLAAVAFGWPREAAAVPVGPIIAATQTAAAGIGPGYVDNVNATCGATATLVRASGQMSIDCECDSAVHWGQDSVTTSSYSKITFGGNVGAVYCLRPAAADVDCRCVALVPSNPN
jgi:hypothetical protein